ncbi:MAG: metallophosphoesterase [Thalassotalea sp.]
MPTELTFAQFTDCHLFADKEQCHHGARVYQNLVAVLKQIKQMPELDFVIFTGDLTQDHSDASYQNFVDAVTESQLTLPLYWLAGNHDEMSSMATYLNRLPFNASKQIESTTWQVMLLNSKSDTPAGIVSTQQLSALTQNINANKFQLLVMHHHAVDVGYFIDRHGLLNQAEFWQQINQHASIKSIACGHVHNALTKYNPNSTYQVPVITCPATSIQFSQTATTVCNANLPAGFRTYQLFSNGKVETSAHYLPINYLSSHDNKPSS